MNGKNYTFKDIIILSLKYSQIKDLFFDSIEITYDHPNIGYIQIEGYLKISLKRIMVNYNSKYDRIVYFNHGIMIIDKIKKLEYKKRLNIFTELILIENPDIWETIKLIKT